MLLTNTPAPIRDSEGYYEIDGKRLRSVTTYLRLLSKEALIHWAAKLEQERVVRLAVELQRDGPNRDPGFFQKDLEAALAGPKAWRTEMESAGDAGSAIHKIIEWHLAGRNGERPFGNQEQNDCADAGIAYLAAQAFKPILVEKTVWSLNGEYAGTLDAYGTINTPEGRICTVVDFKSGGDVYAEAVAQLGAYGRALAEMGLHDSDTPLAGLILHVSRKLKTKKAKPYFISPEALKAGGLAFLDVVRAFNSAKTCEDILKESKAAYKKEKEEAA